MPYTVPQPYPMYTPYQPAAYGVQYAPTAPQGAPMQTPAPVPMQQSYAPAPMQAAGLNGQFVDSVDVVKGINALTDGTPAFFPTRDMKTIYVKQLQADGTSPVRAYTLADAVQEKPQPSVSEIVGGNIDTLRGDIKAMIDRLGDDIGEISDRLGKLERRSKKTED